VAGTFPRLRAGEQEGGRDLLVKLKGLKAKDCIQANPLQGKFWLLTVSLFLWLMHSALEDPWREKQRTR
jgi:hypothetical protein